MNKKKRNEQKKWYLSKMIEHTNGLCKDYLSQLEVCKSICQFCAMENYYFGHLEKAEVFDSIIDKIKLMKLKEEDKIKNNSK